MSDNTEITLISAPRENVIAAYRDADLMDGILSAVEKSARSEAFDFTTAAGREAAKSLAYKVARSKTFLDGIGKDLTEEARKTTADVNARRKVITDRLDALRDEVKAGAVEWEAAEKARIDGLAERLKDFEIGREWFNASMAELLALHDGIAAIETGEDWQEFQAEAEIAKAAAIGKLAELIEAETAAEEARAQAAKERAELEELRAFKAEQERAKAEAEAAERRAAEEAQRAKLEAQRKEEAEAEAQRRADQAAEAARLKAEQDAAEAIRRAERAAEQAREDERRRIAAEQAEAAAAAEKRERNTRARNKAFSEIAQSLMDGGMEAEAAHKAADLLISGKVARVKVEF